MPTPAQFSHVIRDNNMEPFLFAGDTVSVQRTRTVREGDLVMIEPRGSRDCVIGLLRKRSNGFILQRTRWANLVLGDQRYFQIVGRIVAVIGGSAARDAYTARTKKRPATSVGARFRVTIERARAFERADDPFEEISSALHHAQVERLSQPPLPLIVYPSELPEPTSATPLLREVQFDARRITSRSQAADRMFQALTPLDDVGRPKGELLITRRPTAIQPGSLLVCKYNSRYVVRYVGIDERLRVFLETLASRQPPIYLRPDDQLEVLGEVLEQQLDMSRPSLAARVTPLE